ncbi:hypothetical protein CJ030_MR3G026500 [Morella rubra]|uniref:Glycolipid transfer protein domain-containing protein n=1 Tax=Morella rubra TaxID=262757 RepID=A0A6A1W761_9ROSI|nr:hypothetical protein CJ030_MR3G026500 [Morella rubra]
MEVTDCTGFREMEMNQSQMSTPLYSPFKDWLPKRSKEMEGKNLKDATMTPLSAVAEAFEEMAKLLKSRKEDQQLRLDTFCEACSLVSVFFGCLGLAFKFAESEYLSKIQHSLKEAASRAYRQIWAPYHRWSVRTAVAAGMCTLPAREKLLVKLKETDSSAEKKMRRYISAADTVIEYIDNLYLSKNISLDW